MTPGNVKLRCDPMPTCLIEATAYRLVVAGRRDSHCAGNLVAAPSDLIVESAPADEGARAAADQHAPHASDNDRMGGPLDAFVDFAVEHRDRIGKTGNPARERRPTTLFEALLSVDAGSAGEASGDLALIGRQNIDCECAEARQGGVARRRAMEANEQGRRLGGERSYRCRRQAGSLAARPMGDDAYAARELTHRFLERRSRRVRQAAPWRRRRLKPVNRSVAHVGYPRRNS